MDSDSPRPEAAVVDQQVIDELTAVCNSIGLMDRNDGTYMKDRDCKPCLKEIIRYLNSDSKKHAIRIHLGSLNIIKSDLIPLMVQYCDYNEGDLDLFRLVLRICTNLTSSVLMLFEHQEVPKEPESIAVYNKLLAGLYAFKEAFAADLRVWKTLNIHLKHSEDETTFERLIVLIRNILHIPVDSASDMGIHSEYDVHDMCIARMDKSGMLHTLIHIASETQRGTEFCFHIMEIVYLILRNQNPLTLINAKSSVYKRTLDDEDSDKKRYAEMSARARRERGMQSKLASARFKDSMFVVRNYRSLSENSLTTRTPTISRTDIKFDNGKTDLRKAKNKKPISTEGSFLVISDRSTKPSTVSYSLRTFCKLFVEKIYANFMQQIKHNLIQKRAAEDDESYYLWALQFFTAFNRGLYLSMDNISETLSTSSLHFIQILISNYQDKLKMEKSRSHHERLSKRLHLAVRAYRELLYLIQSIQPDSDFWNMIEKIKRNIFTELEYSTLILNLFQQYSEPKHSDYYLKDLITTNHVFLDLLEQYSESHDPIEISDNDGDDDEQKGNQEDEPISNEHQPEGAQPKEVQVEAKPKKRSRKRKKHDLKTTHFMSRYCCPDVIRIYLSVLKNFKTNDLAINMAILKFLERIVYDCHYEVLLFQAQVFKCLLEISDYSLPGYQGFVELGEYLFTKFGSMANKRVFMYQELLFWKTTNDVREIELAIDPPPPVAVATRDDEEPPIADEIEDLPSNSPDEGEEEQPRPDGSLAKLHAELFGSDDDDDNHVSEGADDSVSEGADDNGEEAADDDEVAAPTQASGSRRLRLSSSSNSGSLSLTKRPALSPGAINPDGERSSSLSDFPDVDDGASDETVRGPEGVGRPAV